MKNHKDAVFNIIKLIVLSIMFYLAIYFENPSGNRLYTLIGLFIVYISISIARGFIKNRNVLIDYSFIIDVGLIYLMEQNSRFLINYFFHSFYIIILLESSLTLNRNKNLIIGVITVGVSLIKYILLIYYKSNLGNLSEIIFIILINALILITINFAQYHKEEKEKKDLLYGELLNTHKKLKEYSKRVEELTKIEERNRIARDIHDTLGHNMTALIMQIEMAEHIMDSESNNSKKILNEAKETARNGLVKIREVVETLNVKNEELRGIDSIKRMINDFADKTKINIELQVEESMILIDPIVDASLYRIIQESLTNSVRHGKSTEIKVILKYDDKGVGFIISDNGVGVKKIKPGYGIKGMKERVKTLSGNISFEGNEGFQVAGYLPMEVKR